MDELDARLRAMAKREDWALPAAYESAMDGLEEQIRQGGTLDRPGKRRLGKRVLILAASVAVLACGLQRRRCRMDCLECPVVEDGLVAAGKLNPAPSGQTVEEIHRDPTLESAFTDGRAICCLVGRLTGYGRAGSPLEYRVQVYWQRHPVDRWADWEECHRVPCWTIPWTKSSLLETAQSTSGHRAGCRRRLGEL